MFFVPYLGESKISIPHYLELKFRGFISVSGWMGSAVKYQASESDYKIDG